MSLANKGIEELFLKIFKGIVLLIMGLALVSILLLVAASIYQYSQSPKEPTPAQNANLKDVGSDDIKKFLLDEEKKKNENDSDTNQVEQIPAEKHAPLLFNAEALELYRCSDNFGKAVGALVEKNDNIIISQEVEHLRASIEEIASNPARGEPWVKAAVAFTCNTLSDKTIIGLKKEGKIGAAFLPILNFHINSWDKIQADKLEFELNEERRVNAVALAEHERVTQAKATAFTFLIGSAGALGLFMLLSLYLLGARIENNLKNINESILEVGRK